MFGFPFFFFFNYQVFDAGSNTSTIKISTPSLSQARLDIYTMINYLLWMSNAQLRLITTVKFRITNDINLSFEVNSSKMV